VTWTRRSTTPTAHGLHPSSRRATSTG
jgi:hypothetical protein